MKFAQYLLSANALFFAFIAQAAPTTITFEDLRGSAPYGYDTDGDSINDVVFSTPCRFETGSDTDFGTDIPPSVISGRALLMPTVSLPGAWDNNCPNSDVVDFDHEAFQTGDLSLYPEVPELRIDFLNGAVTNLNFGTALIGGEGEEIHFSVYDSNDSLLNSVFMLSPEEPYPTSVYTETEVNLDFDGVASYAILDVGDSLSGFVPYFYLDNFTGTFSSVVSVPEPRSSILFLLSILLMRIKLRRKS